MKKKSVSVFWEVLNLFLVGILIFTYFYDSTRELRFAEKLGNGINLGNSLDATDLWNYKPEADELEYEEFWNNPAIRRKQLKAIVNAGFRTVRIPVTWEDHIDENGVISSRWMNRVQDVVDMAIEEGLFVIINTHHEDWLDLRIGYEEEITTRFKQVWQQIAEHFKGYGENLLFESMNEPRLRDSEYEWTAGTEELRGMVNRLNKAFVETVRSTGEYNEKRYLLICPYATNNLTEVMEDLEIPRGNIIVSIHLYKPYHFCQEDGGTSVWSSESAADVEQIDKAFEDMKRYFIRKGIPVLLTETGCKDKDNLGDRIEWLSYLKEKAEDSSIGIIWWDNGKEYRLLNREKGTWFFPELVDIMTE